MLLGKRDVSEVISRNRKAKPPGKSRYLHMLIILVALLENTVVLIIRCIWLKASYVTACRCFFTQGLLYGDALVREEGRKGERIVSLRGGGHTACGELDAINGETEPTSA